MPGTNVHLWAFHCGGARHGAKFYVIDPVRNRTGRTADRHFAINPGSDLAFALGMIHGIFRDGLQDHDYVRQHTEGSNELCELARHYPPTVVAGYTGLSVESIEGLAQEYARTGPAVIRLNYGVQRSERGGAAVRAIAALPALVGS